MKLAIIGTRGIPNNYGGFEQFAEYVSVGLVEKGHEVTVYCPHTHPTKDKVWKGVRRISVYDPEVHIGTAGQFFYDLFCILDARRRGFDTILQLGYTSSSIWGRLMPKKAKVFTNMDGLEWKRTKFSPKVQKFLKWAEKQAVKTSDVLISDSIGIQEYLRSKYGVESTFIPYGAHLFHSPDAEKLKSYEVSPGNYHMLIARMEPENNVETILDGYAGTKMDKPFLVVGKTSNEFGKYLVEKFKHQPNIRFLGGIYDLNMLDNLRWYCDLYFHGHSVGGTNPSLLEAMASSAFICAHRNPFNGSVLGEDAWYFSNSTEVAELLNRTTDHERAEMIEANREKIRTIYSWEKIISDYEDCLLGK